MDLFPKFQDTEVETTREDFLIEGIDSFEKDNQCDHYPHAHPDECAEKHDLESTHLAPVMVAKVGAGGAGRDA